MARVAGKDVAHVPGGSIVSVMARGWKNMIGDSHRMCCCSRGTHQCQEVFWLFRYS